MERLWVVLALALVAAMAPTANAREAENAAFCLGCTTDAQFKLAAVEGFGAGLEGSRHALVGNPNTGDFRQVTLTRTAAGAVKVTAMSRLALDKAEAQFSDDVRTKIFVTNCNGVVQLPSAASRNADAADGGGHAVERGTLVQLDAKVYGLVLCRSPLFASYSNANRPALSRALQLAALRAYP